MTSYHIVTHSGRFHADEVSAVALIELLLGEKAIVVRTRDMEVIDKLSASSNAYVVDVGGVYDPEVRRFDHHQTEMDKSFADLEGMSQKSENSFKIPVSSLGLVYHGYGRQIIEQRLGVEISAEDKEVLYRNLYYTLCRDIDANDNGRWFKQKDVKVNYTPNMTLIALISSFNMEDHDSPEQDLAFRRAVDFASLGLSQLLTSQLELFKAKLDIKNNLSSYRIGVEEALTLLNPHETLLNLVSVLVLRTPLNYKRVINEIDPEYKWKFIITKKNDDQWKVATRGLPGMVNLVNLISETEAKELFDDVTFIHKARFVGEARSFSTAFKICELSLRKNELDSETDEVKEEPS